jgi:catechol 2,3-dioxygenase-like lactoylglutathione lyase family enzyme
MILGFDHVIFYVADPEAFDAACATFEDAGFLITDRLDADRDTAAARQRLVCLADGTYIEILTIRDADARGNHRLARHMNGRTGWADTTLLTDRLSEIIAVQSKAGFAVHGPVTHARRLSDGRPWSVAIALPGIGYGHPALPFFLQDEMGREFRNPPGRTAHPNGATGTAGLSIATPDLELARVHYRPIFGEPQQRGNILRYTFGGGCWIELHEGKAAIREVVLSGLAGFQPELAALHLRPA